MAAATANPFDLLGDYDHDDPSTLIAAQQKKAAAAAPPRAKKALPPAQPSTNSLAKLPSKPLPPAEAAREARRGRGGSRAGGGRGSGRGRGGFNGRDNYGSDENGVLENGFRRRFGASEDGEVEKPSGGGSRNTYRGARGGRPRGYLDGEPEEGEWPARRQFDRHSGTGRGGIKREGSGRGNWGTPTDQGQVKKPEEFINSVNMYAKFEEKPVGEEDGVAVDKENAPGETKEKEPEDKEMTLDEYEKLLEEKRKALQALQKIEERKVDVDKEFEFMQQLSAKKNNDDVFIKLGSERESARRRDAADREDSARRPAIINTFLRPAEEARHYNPGGRGRGRGGRGARGGFGRTGTMNTPPPSIEDPGHFPTLGGN
ncbi:RGG repeats nuclear RNA binding protein A isoform X2 [Phoenix dactylifera]|uniref:RGG repeats nuclear RNA binding protein A isoform X2 n=1 Tax=Phoenix dactylifera TaxID=42345 RepID=A0A8B7CGM6_PHODC|nr:RGG repeats nuclear RNA binding protein A isoform X2 [Phoenix dactylifera]